jgi:hypothetical protein
MNWNYDDKYPDSEGWYAVRVCWDPVEGVCSGTAYWDGNGWRSDGWSIVAFSDSAFATEKEALEWAYANELEWQ